MPFPANPKHEIFAQGLAQGLSVGAAYVQAGYKASDSSASHLSRNPKVQARVDELVAGSAALATFTTNHRIQARVQEFLAAAPKKRV